MSPHDRTVANFELAPPQAPEVEAAIAAALTSGTPAPPDPWWQAGIDEALETYPPG